MGLRLTKNDKLYKYTDDGVLITVRVKKVKNENCFVSLL